MYDSGRSSGDGVPPYLLHSYNTTLKKIIIVASLRFNATVDSEPGTELQKVTAAKETLSAPTSPQAVDPRLFLNAAKLWTGDDGGFLKRSLEYL